MPGVKGRSGGARPNGGRPKGSKNRVTKKRREVAEQLLDETSGRAPADSIDAEAEAAEKKRGKTPLHVLVRLYTHDFDAALDDDSKVIDEAKLEKAGAWADRAAPYMHPKLAAVDGTPEGMNKSHEEALKELE